MNLKVSGSVYGRSKELDEIIAINEKYGKRITIQEAQKVMHFFIVMADIVLDQIHDKQSIIENYGSETQPKKSSISPQVSKSVNLIG